jgi:hypothetical protein
MINEKQQNPSHKYDDLTLAQLAKKFSDFYYKKTDKIMDLLEDAPDRKRLIESEMQKISAMMGNTLAEQFEIPSEEEIMMSISRQPKGKPVEETGNHFLRFTEEEKRQMSKLALPLNHGGSGLVRYGYHQAINGGDIMVQTLRVNGLPSEAFQMFVDGSSPLYFIPKYGIGISGTTEHQRQWLEGLFYVVRGANYAFYYAWLEEQLDSLVKMGKLKDTPEVIELGGLPQRMLMADRLGLIDAMERELIARGVAKRKRSNSFYIVMAQIFGVASFETMSDYIKQTGHPADVPLAGAKKSTAIHTPEN